MPNLRELVESTGATIDNWFYDQSNPNYASNQQLLADATAALYGNVGANLDTRNWDAIMASDNTIQSANDALAAMYSDPEYQAQNTANLVKQGYNPAQAYYTYGQMNDRVGANYVPSESEVAAVENYFKDLGSPIKWSVSGGGSNPTSVAKTGTGSVAGSNTGSQLSSGSSPAAAAPTLPTPSPDRGAFQTVGAADGQLMGAGNADYKSSLIKSLRQSSLTPFSSNTGIEVRPNPGMITSNWTPPTGADAAFNPQVLNPRAASQQEISDWNNYQAYKTNALGAKTPILSLADWIAGGRSDGKPVAQTPAPDYDASWSGY